MKFSVWGDLMENEMWPKRARNGVVFWVGGWLGVYGFMFAFSHYYGQEFSKSIILQTTLLGVGLSYFVIQRKNWARTISIFGNIVPMLLALAYLLYVHVFHIIELNWVISALSFLVMACFGLSIYYLAHPDTKRYFKLFSGQTDDSSDEPKATR